MPQHVPWLTLLAVYGACVGSFLNVVIYRMPEGIGLVTPRSRCPGCGKQIAWYDNIPLLSWLLLRGKCRSCKTGISVQYPLIELLCSAMFVGVYVVDYISGWRPEFQDAGFGATWSALVVQLVMVAALLAATVIDARLYIIPVRIPQTVALAALVILPVASLWLPAMEQTAPVVDARGLGATIGGVVGLAVALLLLHLKLLPRSFDEVEDTLDEAEPADAFFSHPHPRREVLKECLFVGLPVLGAAVGLSLMHVPQDYLAAENQYPLGLRVLGGVLCGYLVGGGVIWGVRILGTLVFGREAMGLGDVHLLAAIGCVLGAGDAVAVFFIAPFFGLFAAAVQGGLAKLWKSRGRVIPYGPYLALAGVVMLAGRGTFWSFFGMF